eukprot:2967133-Amphidinium_carterae.1
MACFAACVRPHWQQGTILYKAISQRVQPSVAAGAIGAYVGGHRKGTASKMNLAATATPHACLQQMVIWSPDSRSIQHSDLLVLRHIACLPDDELRRVDWFLTEDAPHDVLDVVMQILRLSSNQDCCESSIQRNLSSNML